MCIRVPTIYSRKCYVNFSSICDENQFQCVTQLKVLFYFIYFESKRRITRVNSLPMLTFFEDYDCLLIIQLYTFHINIISQDERIIYNQNISVKIQSKTRD